jgi:hypothetical protein
LSAVSQINRLEANQSVEKLGGSPGAPLGNANVERGKRWSGAIRRALNEYTDDNVKQGEALLKIAEGIVREAIAGDKDAIREIGNRLDGKPAQALTLSGDSDSPLDVNHKVEFVSRIERVLVRDGAAGLGQQH